MFFMTKNESLLPKVWLELTPKNTKSSPLLEKKLYNKHPQPFLTDLPLVPGVDGPVRDPDGPDAVVVDGHDVEGVHQGAVEQVVLLAAGEGGGVGVGVQHQEVLGVDGVRGDGGHGGGPLGLLALLPALIPLLAAGLLLGGFAGGGKVLNFLSFSITFKNNY